MTEPKGVNIERGVNEQKFKIPEKVAEVPEGIREAVKKEYGNLIKASLRRYEHSSVPIDVSMPAFLSLQEAHLASAVEKVRLEKEFQKDELTGLLKLSAIRQQYEIALGRLNKENSSEEACLAVVTFDLDFFRQINEKLGHSGADEILKEIGQKLGNDSGNLRPGDVTGRVGGDEFVIILSNIKKNEVEGALQRIHSIVGSITRPETGEVKSSFGALILSGGDTKYFDEARTISDEATYGVKNYGRNGYAIVEGKQVKIVNKNENGEYIESYEGVEMPQPDEGHRIKEVGNALQRITEQMELAKSKPCFNESKIAEVESAVEVIGKAYFQAKECNESFK